MEILAVAVPLVIGFLVWLRINTSDEPDEPQEPFVAPDDTTERQAAKDEHTDEVERLKRAARRDEGMNEYIADKIAGRKR